MVFVLAVVANICLVAHRRLGLSLLDLAEVPRGHGGVGERLATRPGVARARPRDGAQVANFLAGWPELF